MKVRKKLLFKMPKFTAAFSFKMSNILFLKPKPFGTKFFFIYNIKILLLDLSLQVGKKRFGGLCKIKCNSTTFNFKNEVNFVRKNCSICDKICLLLIILKLRVLIILVVQ